MADATIFRAKRVSLLCIIFRLKKKKKGKGNPMPSSLLVEDLDCTLRTNVSFSSFLHLLYPDIDYSFNGEKSS